MKRWKLALAVAGLALSMGAVLPLSAQQGGGNNPGGGGRFDPAAMEARLKESLGATDDEWKVIQPKIQKVNEVRRAQGGGFGGFGGGAGGGRGRGQGGGGGGAAGGDAGAPVASRPANPVADAQAELRTVLANKDSTPEQIKSKLEALRTVRAKSREDLKKAQDDLKSVLTARQEAVLVSNGTLE